VTVRTADASVTRRVLVLRAANGRANFVLGQRRRWKANDGTVPETQAAVHARKIGVIRPSQAESGPTLESVIDSMVAVCLSSDWEPLMPGLPSVTSISTPWSTRTSEMMKTNPSNDRRSRCGEKALHTDPISSAAPAKASARP